MTTTTVSASSLRTNLADTLDAVTNEDVIIVTRRGKRERAIVDLDRLEDLLAAANPEYIKTIRMARESKDYFSHDEVFEGL